MRLYYSLIVLSVVLFSGCVGENQDISPTQTPPTTQGSELGGTIKIAAFNIQTFGQSKAGNPVVMDILSRIVRNFDVVAIEEIRDASQTAMPALRDRINTMGEPKYDFIIGERLGRTTSKEQYAFLFNRETIEYIPGSAYTYPEPAGHDLFHREPLVAAFKARNGNFDFVLIVIHTDPDEATEEINSLPIVITDAQARFQGEGDFIVLGDLNADCKYFDENSASPLRTGNYIWLMDNTVDTTTKATDCTYDRIIITEPAKTDYTGTSGAFRFDTLYGLTDTQTVKVSDHYPVYAEFWTNKDTD
jgi:endonuclease/exonuclease/phosphatase family metal-dependent hydrolase